MLCGWVWATATLLHVGGCGAAGIDCAYSAMMSSRPNYSCASYDGVAGQFLAGCPSDLNITRSELIMVIDGGRLDIACVGV